MNPDVRKPLTLKVKDNTYIINSPTIGQLWNIEEFKAILSNGRYGVVLSNRTITSEFSLDTIDMFATLKSLCPQLVKDIEDRVKDWRQMDPFDMLELKKVYVSQLSPWLDRYMKALKEVEDESRKA